VALASQPSRTKRISLKRTTDTAGVPSISDSTTAYSHPKEGIVGAGLAASLSRGELCEVTHTRHAGRSATFIGALMVFQYQHK